MILIVCLPCACALRVSGDPVEIRSLVGVGSDVACLCYNCQNKAERLLESQIDPLLLVQLQITDVSPQEAFAAIHGLGLPTERSCTKEDITELFAQQPVKRVQARNIEGTPRCIVDYIELADGTRLYLDASALGATVYRITRPISYVKKFDEQEVPNG